MDRTDTVSDKLRCLARMHVIFLFISGLTGLSQGLTFYKTCSDALRDLGKNATDGEYVIYTQRPRVGIPIYCHGFSSGRPTEYLTLRSGRSNNFAMFYDNVGAFNTCADKFPRQLYADRGRTEFNKIGINIKSLQIKTDDFTFAKKTAGRNVNYGSAGDQYSSSPDCYPMGVFVIDLTGTPFVVNGNVSTWKWRGNFARGNVSDGKAIILGSSYLGCWSDNLNRLLPSGRQEDSKQTVDKCVAHCRTLGFSYAGLQQGSVCHCGNDYTAFGAALENDCNVRCSGNQSQTCGGIRKVSVYMTSLSDRNQRIEGHCGGYPGSCYPASKLSTDIQLLQLKIIPQHTCLTSNPCLNEGRCIATTLTDYKCHCYEGYDGKRCETKKRIYVLDSVCPPGYVAENCKCTDEICQGAKFEGDMCVVKGSMPNITCIFAGSGHIVLINVNSESEWRNGMMMKHKATCPDSWEMVGCTFWQFSDTMTLFYRGNNKYGQGVQRNGKCLKCLGGCDEQARCKRSVCDCKNNGRCNKVTGECECQAGYYGKKCEIFDYCSYYEDNFNKTACASGGVCTSVPEKRVSTTGGDNAGDHCIFPFEFKGQSYGRCIEENTVGPPFACGGYFNPVNSYIDLGEWSPGPAYTIAAWVKPGIIDTLRKTIAGGLYQCNDFGMSLNSGSFRGFLKNSQDCTRDLDSEDQLAQVKVGQWYMVAVANNKTHLSLHINGKLVAADWVLRNNLPTTGGFRIGGERCCQLNHFNGIIKTVKVWKRALSNAELNQSMYTIGTQNSSYDAIHGGLVGHWELGDVPPISCSGLDHGGEDWTLKDGQQLTGTHCNISRLYIPSDVTVSITPYDGKKGGTLEIYAKEMQIDGYMDGVGVGYRGGGQPSSPAGSGIQGESYSGEGTAAKGPNRGGGGGGVGALTTIISRSGGGAGYGTNGQMGQKTRGPQEGLGAGGRMYGEEELHQLYLGSGGGSGGNARDLSVNPRGGRGGNGGGAVRLVADRSIIITGVISMAGQNGQGDQATNTGCVGCPKACRDETAKFCSGNSTSDCWDYSAPGGGGSGGSIYLTATFVDIGFEKLWTKGGEGGVGGNHVCGGRGGMGRIRIDSVIRKGHIGKIHGSVYFRNLTEQYIDYSHAGQKVIDYKNTVYGNEVYRGCFRDDGTSQLLSYKVPLTSSQEAQMTADFCMHGCRQRGYKFSGTKNAIQCFCDNFLDMSFKGNDEDCSMACKGNPLLTCGNTTMVQIFGPPPGAPARGYNVVPRCEPWCVTADPLANNPKWGQCSKNTAAIADWKIICECPPGFTGTGCDQMCPPWTWGNKCSKNCTCNRNTTASCNPTNGRCQCTPGHQGGQCEETCPPGFFGQGCRSQCTCTYNSVCDPKTGICGCKPGWVGLNCNFPCPPGKFGPNCNLTCNCFHGSCSPEDGTCECEPGWQLPDCYDRCNASSYGQDCYSLCECNNQPCDPITGLCQCGPGYLGSKCKLLCSHGSWGQNCVKKCDCLQDSGCDHMTGHCKCKPGYAGSHCEYTCRDNKFGSNCDNQCSCVQNNTASCDPATGHCTCEPGFRGDNCELPCLQGLYGQNCSQLCNCLHGADCDSANGRCQCSPGFQGNHCETTCQQGFYGDSCARRCPTCRTGTCNKVDGTCICQSGQPCVCPRGFWGRMCGNACSCIHGNCDQNTGSCDCSPGWTGKDCDRLCSKGTYGRGCQLNCTCLHGRCDPVSGVCSCAVGFMGTKCHQSCPRGLYGPGCRYICPLCGPYSAGCHQETGQCMCSTGYTGPYCDRPCPQNTYGDGCVKNCSCQNGGSCDSVSGKCLCMPGFIGQYCQNGCRHMYWGDGCNQQCQCGQYGSACSPLTGACVCKAGFTGVKCRQSCRPGTYGPNCTQTCHCDPSTSQCSPLDGSCQCNAGWAGQYCDTACDAGKWGTGCKQDCQCSNHGNCNPFNGQCDCDPGYKGDHCEQQCEEDIYWGKGCRNKCQCNGEPCDHRDGTCQCSPGKKGYNCEETCDSVHFGLQCGQLCGCMNGAMCDPVTGGCKCQTGWSGEFCDQTCPTGFYGNDCVNRCPPCLNGATCDSLTGQCVCAAGFSGPLCNTTSIIPDSGPKVAEQKASQTGSDKLIQFTKAEFAVLIISLVVAMTIVTIIAVMCTRKRFTGKYVSHSSSVKLQDQHEIGTEELPHISTIGFDNPIHSGFDDSNNDGTSVGEVSAAETNTSGIASNHVDSEDDDEYFKDSRA